MGTQNNYDGFEKYEPIISNFAAFACKNHIYSYEDFVQELRIKLIESWDYIHKEPEKYRFSLAKIILKNRVIDIINYCKFNPDTSVYAKDSAIEGEDEDYSVIDASSENSISESSSFASPNDYTSFRELMGILKDIRDNSDEKVSRFINSIIDERGNEEIESLNDEYEKGIKRVCSRGFILPFLRSKLLGYSSSLPYRVMYIVYHKLKEMGIELPDSYRAWE